MVAQTKSETADVPVSDAEIQSPPDALGPPPDGGLRAWTQVLAGHLINSLTWGAPASFGVYQLYYTETLNLPPSQVSWIGSLQVFLTFFLSAFSGRLADAGYTRHLLFVGLFLILFGTFMTSLCTQYWQILLAQGVCTGIGMGTVFMPAVATVGTYFSTKKSMALAISASGTGTGSLIFPSTVQYLIPQIGTL
jgi:MFS transporter, MCT family, solute carrier family 16 (monocarboxylic acid transporters), member 3